MLQSNWFVEEDKACTALQGLQGEDKEVLRFPFLCGGRTDLQAAGGQEQLNHFGLHTHFLVDTPNSNFFIPKLVLFYHRDTFYLHDKSAVSMRFTESVPRSIQSLSCDIDDLSTTCSCLETPLPAGLEISGQRAYC